MSITGIQGQPLEITVVGGSKLRDTEWFSRQDPYICLEYGSTKFRTRTCTDGGKNPMFQEKFVFQLIEGLRELNVQVWNSNTINTDDFIGSGKIQLHKVLSQGYDDSAWPLQSKHARYAGEVRLILHYQIPAKHAATNWNPSVQPYGAHPAPQAHLYPAPPPPQPHASPYMQQTSAYPSLSAHPTYSAGYPSSPYPTPQPAAAYPPQQYPPPSSGYPPSPYQPHSAYPPSPYQPAPPPQASPYYPQGPYPGAYPSRPY